MPTYLDRVAPPRTFYCEGDGCPGHEYPPPCWPRPCVEVERQEARNQLRHDVREALAAAGRAWAALDCDPSRLLDCAAALQTTIRDAQAACAGLAPVLPAHGLALPAEPPEATCRSFTAPEYLR